jgi:hypothetical protein
MALREQIAEQLLTGVAGGEEVTEIVTPVGSEEEDDF